MSCRRLLVGQPEASEPASQLGEQKGKKEGAHLFRSAASEPRAMQPAASNPLFGYFLAAELLNCLTR